MSDETKNVAETGSEEISKSKQKREQRKADVKAQKRKQNFESIIGWIIGIAIAAGVITIICLGIWESATKTVSDGNYSAYLTDDGRVKGANLKKVKDIGLDGISINYSDIEYKDETIETDINNQLANYAEFSTKKTLEVKDGDTINLDYVGSVDGVPFDGGNTNGQGTELTIGSGKYIDNFEEQLIGAHPGDSVTVNVTFPEVYENNPDLAGKAAVFECVVNSIKVIPEFTDAFVQEHFSEVASTTEELRAYLKSEGEKQNVRDYVSKYIKENASASAPGAYLKHLRQLIKYADEQQIVYLQQLYAYYGLTNAPKTVEEYRQTDKRGYEKDLRSKAKDQAAFDLTFEEFFVRKGLTVTDADYSEVLVIYSQDTDNGNAAETYGEPFLRQVALQHVTLDYIAEHATIVK